MTILDVLFFVSIGFCLIMAFRSNGEPPKDSKQFGDGLLDDVDTSNFNDRKY